MVGSILIGLPPKLRSHRNSWLARRLCETSRGVGDLEMTITLDQFVAWNCQTKGSTHASRVRHGSRFSIAFRQHERMFANRFADRLVAPNSLQDLLFRQRFGKPHVQQVHTDGEVSLGSLSEANRGQVFRATEADVGKRLPGAARSVERFDVVH